MITFLQQCQVVLIDQGGFMLSLFVGGLLGSLSHCTGMCGPIVMAQVGRASGESETLHTVDTGFTAVAHFMRGASLPYHFGRMFTYILLGVMAASFTQYLVGSPVQRLVAALMLAVAGVLFVMKAVPALTRYSAPFAGTRWLGRRIGNGVALMAAPFSSGYSGVTRFLYGVMLGFLPCGLVVAAVMAAASPGDPMVAAFGMAAFALGTMPSLILFGFGSQYALRRWPEKTRKISNTVMALNGLVLCVVAARLAL